jgi:Zn-dependent protease
LPGQHGDFPVVATADSGHCRSAPFRARLANSRLNIYRTDMPDLSPEILVLGFISYVVFLFSTTCHEASHALVAKLGGDSTAALNGQVTLNPIPHIRREPWGMVIIPILAFLFTHGMIGWASAPFDPLWERRYPKRAALMALAGPAANFALMLVGAAGLRISSAMGWLHWRPGNQPDIAIVTLYVLFSLNLLLGTFNLLPLAPLDGSTGIMIFMRESTAQRYLDWLRESSYARLGLLLGLLAFRYFYGPVEMFATNLLLRSHF